MLIRCFTFVCLPWGPLVVLALCLTTGLLGSSKPSKFLSFSAVSQPVRVCRSLQHFNRGKTETNYLGCKEIQPVQPKGNQYWVFIERTDVEADTPILWPPIVNCWLIWKDPDSGKDWRQEEKGTTEDEMVGWHHRLKGHGFGWTLGVGDG